MTLMTMCALTPPLCRMGADPAVRGAVAALSGPADGGRTPLAFMPLAEAMGRFPQDAAMVTSLLGSGELTAETLGRCFDDEALAFFHVCGQCGAGEVLAVLTRCTVAPTAEGLALLIGERRKMLAMARYGLQLLWRGCGAASLPDALAVFPEDGPVRSAGEVVDGLVRQLTGGDRHG